MASSDPSVTVDIGDSSECKTPLVDDDNEKSSSASLLDNSPTRARITFRQGVGLGIYIVLCIALFVDFGFIISKGDSWFESVFLFGPVVLLIFLLTVLGLASMIKCTKSKKKPFDLFMTLLAYEDDKTLGASLLDPAPTSPPITWSQYLCITVLAAMAICFVIDFAYFISIANTSYKARIFLPLIPLFLFLIVIGIMATIPKHSGFNKVVKMLKGWINACRRNRELV